MDNIYVYEAFGENDHFSVKMASKYPGKQEE